MVQVVCSVMSSNRLANVNYWSYQFYNVHSVRMTDVQLMFPNKLPSAIFGVWLKNSIHWSEVTRNKTVSGTLCLLHYVTKTSHLYSLRDFWRHFCSSRAAVHSDCCFFAPCTNILTYLLTYLYRVQYCKVFCIWYF